jgi:hypothetical protein
MWILMAVRFAINSDGNAYCRANRVRNTRSYTCLRKFGNKGEMLGAYPNRGTVVAALKILERGMA